MTERRLVDLYESGRLSVRTAGYLIAAGMETLEEVAAIGEHGFLRVKNIGKGSLEEIKRVFTEESLVFSKNPRSPPVTGLRKPKNPLVVLKKAIQDKVKNARPSWDQYFLAMADVVATRATCDRKHVGAIIVDERHRIVSTGYNGSPKGLPHCDDVGHILKEIDGRESCVATLHAESNALDDAGRRALGGTIYVTVTPCFNCAKRIANAGIVRVVWSEHYESQNTGLVLDFLRMANVEFSESIG